MFIKMPQRLSLYLFVTTRQMLMVLTICTWTLLAVNANLTNTAIAAISNEDKCIMQEDDLWDVHAWYFAEAKTITVKILAAVHYDGYLKDYVDHFLKLIYARNLERTISVYMFNITQSRFARSIHVSDDTNYYESLPRLDNKTRKALNQARSYSGDQDEGHVLIVWNDQLLFKYLKSQSEKIIENTRATYLILFVEHNTGINCIIDSASFGKVLPMIWDEFKILNAITLAPCSCNPRSIFKYDPFFYDKQKDSWGLIKERTLSEAKANPFRVINTLRSFKGATLNVTLFERIPSAVRGLPETMKHYDCMYQDLSHGFSGFDGCILGNLAYYMNFATNIVKSPDYGYQLANGTYIGSLAEVVYKRADFSANSRFVTAMDTKNIEYTTPVFNDIACFIVPKPERMPKWMMIFRCFNLETWIALGGMSLILALFLHFGWKLDFCTVHHNEGYLSDLINIFAISIGTAVNVRTKITHQRVILASCMIFNVIVVGIFQGSLFKSFSVISYYPHINTLEELYASGLPISTSVDVFQDGQSEILKKLKTRRIYLTEKAITRTAYKRDVVAVERQNDARFLMQTKYVSEQGVPLLHIVPECPSSYFLAYAVQKNSPYLPRFNDLLTRFLEGGFINKWYGDVFNGFIMRKRIHSRNDEKIEKAFNMEDVQTAFYILVWGLVIASVALIFEILNDKRKTFTRFLIRLLDNDKDVIKAS